MAFFTVKFWLAISLLTLSLSIASQDCRERLQVNFSNGEILEYELVYNWGLIWAKAGYVTFSVKDTLVNGVHHWNFRGNGTSARHWDWFYKVRANYESISDLRMHSKKFERTGQEGSHLYNREYIFHNDLCQYSFLNEEGIVRSKTFAIPPCSFDVMTAIYYCRSIPYNEFEIDEMVPLNLVLDGALNTSHVRYIGKERWTDPNTDIEYNCIKFKPLLIDGTVFKEGESMTVWVTDDKKRVPVYVETELVVGKAKVFLINYPSGK
jgi:hypothetical protein